MKNLLFVIALLGIGYLAGNYSPKKVHEAKAIRDARDVILLSNKLEQCEREKSNEQ